ncbi:MAG: NAD+ synthase [Planctomycetes bacterium]|nr:NAD+ synthase [Planctomycetota bacterium]
MRVALCQINPTVGDFDGNRRKIESAVAEAHRGGAELAVLSEMAVLGYPAGDLLLRDDFLAQNDRVLAELAAHLPPDLPVLVGCVARNPGRGLPIYNAAALLHDGFARIVARKSLLPTYDIFDEARYFESNREPSDNVFEIGGKRIGVTICEDAWNDEEFFSHQQRYHIDPVAEVVAAGVDFVVNLSASPWGRQCGDSCGKHEFRARMLTASTKRHDVPIVFVNQAGGNVGVVFDGGSTGFGPRGLACEPVYFQDAVQIVDTDAAWEHVAEEHDLLDMQFRAIVQGIADYGAKFGFSKAVLGLSGGIDSALTAVLAAAAFGAANVTGIAMPSTFSSAHSRSDARALAENLGIAFHEIPIEGLQTAYADALHDVFRGTEPGVAEENLQARSRGALLMAFSNKFGAMLLTTGNKSEAAVGYCTLYGDMCGALAPIADLWKTEVYAMSRWVNREREVIPSSTIEKPPSAELRPDQLDTDSLPAYDELDPVLRMLIEEERGIDEVAERTGMPGERVLELFRLVQRNEFKRFQYAPTIRVSERCWDGRRVPVSHRFP